MKAILAACMIMLAATPGWAQDAAAKPDDAKIALASQILVETHAQDNLTKVLDLLVPAMVARMRQHSATLTDDQVKIISDSLVEEMKAGIPKMLTIQARVYAEHFTLEELQQLEDFYKTTLGQKLIAETPKIAREALPLGMAWGREAGEQAMQHVVAKLRAQGMKI